MKLIKAYVRNDRSELVVRALEHAGAPGIPVVTVHGVGWGYDPLLFQPPNEIGSAPRVAKLEVVCHDDEVQTLVDAIIGAAWTGRPGDGIVFVTPVERAVKIRTREDHLARLHQAAGAEL